jgi:hypothetical protein
MDRSRFHNVQSTPAADDTLTMAQEDIAPIAEIWSIAEQWVWDKNRQGCVADFNHERSSALDPWSPDEWTDDRELRPIFFATMLTREPYRSHFLRFGMRIRGAWIREPLILEGVSVPHRLSLDRCRFESAADFSELRAERRVSFDGSAFGGTLKLINARVDGDLSLASARFAAEIDAQGLRVTSDLVLTASSGIQADFRQTVIGGRVFGRGLRFRKRLDMEGIKVASDLLIRSARADDIAKGITGWQLGYLAAHRVLGFLLSSFVVAGLSGFTQK